MAVTGPRCNPPLWRFHCGPDPLSPTQFNPEALRLRPLGCQPSSLTNRASRGRNGWRRPSLCSCHSRMSIRPGHRRSTVQSGGVALGGSSLQRRSPLRLPAGLWFLWKPEASGTGMERTALRERSAPRDGRSTGEATEEAGRAWLRPECNVPFSGRHGRRQPDRSGGVETRRSASGPSGAVRLGLSRSTEPGTVPVPVTYCHKTRAPALLVPPPARHSVATPSITRFHAPGGRRTVVQQPGRGGGGFARSRFQLTSVGHCFCISRSTLSRSGVTRHAPL